MSDETKAKMSVANRKNQIGRKFYNDGVQNFRLLDGDPRIPNLTKGRIMSDAHLEKIIARNKSAKMREIVRQARIKEGKTGVRRKL